jgi:probable selenate reductase FAD-binding subunit
MSTDLREYHRPVTVLETNQLLKREDTRTIPLFIGARIPSDPLKGVEVVLDLSQMGLAYVATLADGLHIGSLTPLQELIDSPDAPPNINRILSPAVRLTSHYGLRHLATLGGTLLAAQNAAELLSALLVLDSIVRIHGNQELPRNLSLTEFLAAGEQALETGEIIVEVVIPHPAPSHYVLQRIARTPLDESIVSATAAFHLHDGLCQKVRIAVSGVSTTPQRLPTVEQAVEGKALSAEVIQSAAAAVAAAIGDPPADYRGSAEYRRAMAGVMVRRALAEAGKF